MAFADGNVGDIELLQDYFALKNVRKVFKVDVTVRLSSSIQQNSDDCGAWVLYIAKRLLSGQATDSKSLAGCASMLERFRFDAVHDLAMHFRGLPTPPPPAIGKHPRKGGDDDKDASGVSKRRRTDNAGHQRGNERAGQPAANSRFGDHVVGIGGDANLPKRIQAGDDETGKREASDADDGPTKTIILGLPKGLARVLQVRVSLLPVQSFSYSGDRCT